MNLVKEIFEQNGFKFECEENGTVTATGIVTENPASRAGMEKINPNNYDSKVNDKGHLIAAREGGVAKQYNASAQDRGLNRGAYKSVENAEVRLANDGYKVEVSKTAYVSNVGSKPDVYMINDRITDEKGQVQHVNLSFLNESRSDQQEWNDIAEQYSDYEDYPNPDSAREKLSVEEYSELMESTSEELSSIRDEFDMENSNEVSFDYESVSENDAESFCEDTDSGYDGECSI